MFGCFVDVLIRVLVQLNKVVTLSSLPSYDS